MLVAFRSARETSHVSTPSYAVRGVLVRARASSVIRALTDGKDACDAGWTTQRHGDDRINLAVRARYQSGCMRRGALVQRRSTG